MQRAVMLMIFPPLVRSSAAPRLTAVKRPVQVSVNHAMQPCGSACVRLTKNSSCIVHEHVDTPKGIQSHWIRA